MAASRVFRDCKLGHVVCYILYQHLPSLLLYDVSFHSAVAISSSRVLYLLVNITSASTHTIPKLQLLNFASMLECMLLTDRDSRLAGTLLNHLNLSFRIFSPSLAFHGSHRVKVFTFVQTRKNMASMTL